MSLADEQSLSQSPFLRQGCETIVPAWIGKKGKDEFLQVAFGPSGCDPPSSKVPKDDWDDSWMANLCQYICINISNPTDQGWILGKT